MERSFRSFKQDLLIQVQKIPVTVYLLTIFTLLTLHLLQANVIRSAGPCDNPINEIVAENCLPGNPPSEWDISQAGDLTIQGFGTDISYNRGQTAVFKIKTNASAYSINIYRLGYYGGLGARKVATVIPSATLPQTQPNCITDGTTRLYDCGNWATSASWNIPANATSGLYIAKLTRTDTGGASHIIFVVRDDSSTSDFLVQTSDTTWQAYNTYGGDDLYTGAKKVSYNRPFLSRGRSPVDFFFSAEYALTRFLEANGYSVSYFSGVDTDRFGSLLLNHKAFLSVGHDEYWSGNQRANVETAQGQGVNLAFFSGNEMFWKTRWENSIAGPSSSYRTLVTYKETQVNAKIDPLPGVWTGTWRDPRFSPPADGGRPENALTGTLYMVNANRNDPIYVPAAFGRMRFWRGTSVASLPASGSATLPAGVLGDEWDEVPDNGFSPPGLVRLSSTTIDVSPQYLLDYGSTYGNGVATHHLVLYKHASGALVFGSGTFNWPLGLDATHDPFWVNIPVDNRMQQATVNLFADMGIQPASLQSGLTAATKSIDTTSPTSQIVNPAGSIEVGQPTTISGTASDSGGIIGGIEISTDNGVRWHSATGWENWTYNWTPTTTGQTTIKTRAVDDSGNIQSTPTAKVITVTPAATSSLFTSQTPPSQAHPDPGAIELGVKFKATVAGKISGIRFYKATGNSGTHMGRLWSSTGTKLAEATFTNETATGWQQVNFPTPINIISNTTYVASYFAPIGYYVVTRPFFNSDFVNGQLIALASSTSGGNGIFGGGGLFPTSSYLSGNYWVDVVFSNNTAPTSTSTPTPTPTPIASPTPTPTVIPSPSPSLTPTPTPSSTPTSLFSTQTPPTQAHPDVGAIELGVKFKSTNAGKILGVKFYKAPGNSGTHIGRLWSSAGVKLAEATFTGETATGWQQVNFAQPVNITANTSYVVSYFTPTGYYVVSRPFFNNDFVNGSLIAPASSTSGGNGVYGGSGVFPTYSYLSSNYWVDVVFSP